MAYPVGIPNDSNTPRSRFGGHVPAVLRAQYRIEAADGLAPRR
ncbi:hypothetical protein OMK68_22130 [Rhodococcus pyridinivorans]|nr:MULTISPECIES: hypothetical protein [Rhodococcus]MCW3472292.1 hypothetical protein [Rhodococcus pyridinivorans]